MRFETVALLCAIASPLTAGDRPIAFGLEVGFANQQRMFGSGAPVSGVQMGILHVQVLTSLAHRPERTLRSFQLVNELTLAQSIRPGSRFVFGLSEIARFNFAISRRWSWHIDNGLGISSSGLRVRENDGWMQYLLQTGLGVTRCRPVGGFCTLAQYRLTHLSNNDTTPPNDGLNLHAVFVGMNF